MIRAQSEQTPYKEGRIEEHCSRVFSYSIIRRAKHEKVAIIMTVFSILLQTKMHFYV